MNKTKSTVRSFDLLKCWFAVLSAMVLLISMPASANDISQLISDGELKLNIEIKAQGVAVKQQVALDVEVLSTRPFKEELALPYLDIPNTVVKKDEQKVARSARTIEGTKWFTQKARYYLYPMQAGEFTVPELNIPVSVELASKNVVEGAIQSQPIHFTSKMPVSNIDTDALIVSPNAELSISTDRPLTDEFEVGHAVTATYTLSVANSHMMLLPEINIPDISGVELYRKPAVKENVFNRLNKSNTATLKQQVTLILQEQGKVVLPKQTMTWWNTRTNQLESLTVEQQTLQVGDAKLLDSLSTNSGFQTVSNWINQYWYYLVIAALFIASTARLVTNHFSELQRYFAARQQLNTKKLSIQFCRHIERKQYNKAVQDIYELAGQTPTSNGHFPSSLDPESIMIWNKLLTLEYSKSTTDAISEMETKTLLKAINHLEKKQASPFKFNWNLN
ncbi:BatD family protein [Vibrio methylphosphonaticus]|uniref:BatD family protein n=1 Tax=Vibrio methylphosphonaticus TaxID=2946866 RepID=UPI00202A0C69|nr:BatD family protein [Vibrio methylphosphonaticus]MCL9773749.1 BatD family protein [Vibrio methylphosphonaticus]